MRCECSLENASEDQSRLTTPTSRVSHRLARENLPDQSHRGAPTRNRDDRPAHKRAYDAKRFVQGIAELGPTAAAITYLPRLPGRT